MYILWFSKFLNNSYFSDNINTLLYFLSYLNSIAVPRVLEKFKENLYKGNFTLVSNS